MLPLIVKRYILTVRRLTVLQRCLINTMKFELKLDELCILMIFIIRHYLKIAEQKLGCISLCDTFSVLRAFNIVLQDLDYLKYDNCYNLGIDPKER